MASLCFGMDGETQDNSKEPAVVLRLMLSDCYLLNEQLQSCWIFSRLFMVAVVGCLLLNGKNAYYMDHYLARIISSSEGKTGENIHNEIWK